MKVEYFNPLKQTHLLLLKYLEEQLVTDENDIEMYKFGDNTQHIFKGGKYLMTINWKLI